MAEIVVLHSRSPFHVARKGAPIDVRPDDEAGRPRLDESAQNHRLLIGGRRPLEIAISILVELTAAKNGVAVPEHMEVRFAKAGQSER